MRSAFTIIMMAIICIAGNSIAGRAQTPLGKKESKEVVESIVEPWEEWETMTISGKLKAPGLPLSPSVKIYMERDSIVRISLRAPLMGEVGRAEIDTDSILVVNKMKKTYVKESISDVTKRYPVTLGDIQSLLIGRAVIPGAGELSADAASLVELYGEEGGEYSLIPGEEMALDDFSYGWLIGEDMAPSVLLVIPEADPETNITLTYEYPDNGYNLIFSMKSPDKILWASLELGFPQIGGSPIEPARINRKFTRMDFQKFLKSF